MKTSTQKEVIVNGDLGDDYWQLNVDVGIDSVVVADELLRRCLKSLKIFIYDIDKVEERLKEIFIEHVWIGIRSKCGTRVYNKLIPEKALRNVKKILSDFPYSDSLRFEVSDGRRRKVSDKDPFMSVRFKNSKTRFVIACWDEPDFRLEK